MANTATLKHPLAQLPTAAPAVAPAYPFARNFAMLSHPGRARHVNEDTCAALPEYGAFVVCDGVGGAAAGEVASQLAAEAFLASLARATPPGRAPKAPASSGDNSPNHPHARLQRAVSAANRAVFQRAQRSRTLHGMGTTLVGLLLDQPPAAPISTLWLAHVGDSRCYLFRRGTLRLLTQDHSLVEEQVRAGLITRTQAAISPIRNIITRAIGSYPTVESDIAAHAAQPGDLFLLASDGLSRELDDDAIAHILARNLGSPTSSLVGVKNPHPPLEPACQALVDAANAHGGRDNITVLLVACL
jgi:serine/threonine protein phosphatase PrpC